MADPTPKEEIEAIKKENLTGRQLRMARRLAQKQGLDPRSDLDAVRLLRRAGIDPFISVEQKRQSVTDELTQNLPSTATMPGGLGPAQSPAEERELHIRKIQQNLVRRRRRRIFFAFTRLFFFILLPTIIAWYYFSFMATPMYSSHSKFVVQKAVVASAAAGGRGGAASMFANAPESVNVQNYLESRTVMTKLDEEFGFRDLFDHPSVDPLQRLDPEATNEQAHDLYMKRIKIAYDPIEGVISLEVSTPDPEASFEISHILREYAEVHVRGMTARADDDKIASAMQNVTEAEEKLSEAQEEVLRLQSEKGIVSGNAEIDFLQSEITQMQTDRSALELEIEELKSNPRFNTARVEAIERQIDRLTERIENNRTRILDGSGDGVSLARIQSELAAAERELGLREGILVGAVEALEAARIETNSNSIYLNRAVEPVISDDKTYPKVFENTLLSFLIFAGIYLMVSLTYSILREQLTT